MSFQEISSEIIARLPKPAAMQVTDRAAKEAAVDATVRAFGKDAMISSAHASPMEAHGAFFDTNFDRKVSVKETRDGLRDMGLGPISSGWLAPVINAGLGGATHPKPGATFMEKLKNFFTIDLDTLVKSSRAEAGPGFDPARKVARLMSFDAAGSGAVTKDELFRYVDTDIPDKGGQVRTKLGFSLLVNMAADTRKTITENGVSRSVPALSRERLTSFYDGTIFYKVAADRGHPHPLAPAP